MSEVSSSVPFIDALIKDVQQWQLSRDLVAHPVTQVIGEQALVDILDLSDVAWTYWGVSTTCLLYTSPSPRD